MSSPAEHTPRHAEHLSLYALGGLPENELTALEAHLALCPDCQRELHGLRAIVAEFIAWRTDVLRPSPSLWNRLAERVGADPRPSVPAMAPEWKDVAPGISCKLLATDRDRGRVSMLVRLDPGTEYPPHRHVGVEELYMLDGELLVDGERFSPGDYRSGPPGSTDRRVWSETGCTCLLITSIHDALLPAAPSEPS